MIVPLKARAEVRRNPDTYPALPPGWQRDPFIHLVERMARFLGIGRAAAHSWTRLAAMTRPDDWTAENREPFVYAAASELAKILGVSEPRLRSHTAQLEKAGLLERRTAANGSRSLHAGTGLYFSGVIMRLPQLVALDKQFTAARHRAMYLRGQRSTHRRCLYDTLKNLLKIAPRDLRVRDIAEAFAAWPRADRLHVMTLEDLVAHEAEADALTRSALDLLEHLMTTSDQPLETERSFLQDTTQDSFVPCDACVEPQCAGNTADGRPDGSEQGPENQRVGGTVAGKTDFVTKIGPERLFWLASPEMQFYLSGRSEPDRLRFHDFIWAAERRLPELDIHPSAWKEACAEMGEDRATLALLVLDAKHSDHRTTLVSPGGYLRGMTRAWQQGQLNLMGSLIGLNERRRWEEPQ